MRIPEKAPDWSNILKDNLENVMKLVGSDDIAKLLHKANKEYLYWDKFKYLSMPEGITSEIAWAYLKLSRSAQVKKIPAIDKEGKQFGYWLPDSILKDLHFIDQHAGGPILADDPNIYAGEKERYLINSIMEEAIASSQLEGAATTRKKAKEMLRSGRRPENHAEQMIVNNYRTIKAIKNIINKPLTPKLLSSLQASMTRDTLDNPDAAGRFRNENEQNQVVDNEGNVLYIPPPASELDKMVGSLCDYANEGQDSEFIHPVIKAIILHFWLAYIHPFVDGNGRTARALFYWYMLKNEYWMFEYLSISRIILKAPAQYARAYLYCEMDGQDITYFISFHLRAICLAIEELKLYLVRQQRELKKTEEFIRDYPGLNHRQHSILYHALSHPDAAYTIDFHKNVHGIVYQTARTDLLDLERRGLLEKVKRGKIFYFVPSVDIHTKLRRLKKVAKLRKR